MAKYIKKWGDNGYINIIGGCCGTTPEHIKEMREYAKNQAQENLLKKNQIH